MYIKTQTIITIDLGWISQITVALNSIAINSNANSEQSACKKRIETKYSTHAIFYKKKMKLLQFNFPNSGNK